MYTVLPYSHLMCICILFWYTCPCFFFFRLVAVIYLLAARILLTISNTIHCTEIQVQFQQSNPTEAREDISERLLLGIQVQIYPPSAILQVDITLTFSAVNGNATGTSWNLCTIQLPCMPTHPLSLNSYLCYHTI